MINIYAPKAQINSIVLGEHDPPFASSLCARRFDLDVDRHRLTNSRYCLGAAAKQQTEIAALERLGRDCPMRFFCIVRVRARQFYMKRDRFGYAMHGEVALNIAALRSSLLDTATLESHRGKFLHVKKLRTAQMVVTLFNFRVDAANVDPGRDG
jgi:hypothetical protein